MQLDNSKLLEAFKALPWNTLIQLFIGLNLFDLLVGYAKSLKIKERAGYLDLIAHFSVALLVVGTYPYLSLIGTGKDTLVTFYLINYAISIVQGLAELGIPVPEGVVGVLNKLKSQEGNYKQDSHPADMPKGGKPEPEEKGQSPPK
ncbi:MAG: phage holin family protein [Turicibacter sp.]|nr:phage holin family protein [Turicibacter sp.]